MRVFIKVHDEAVSEALRGARRETNRGVKEGLKRAVERHGLPTARRLAPGRRIPRALKAGATTRTAYIQLDKRIAPHGAILNYGGIRRDEIRPRHAKALMTPAGPRAVVRGLRHYRPQRFLQRAVSQTRDAVVRTAAEALTEVFESAGLETH